MATGDLKNNIKQLQAELKASKFTQNIDVDGLVSGSPKTYLGIYHYLFTTYSTKLNKDISNSNNELYGKSDMRFMEAVYKILRDMFDYKPQITREQFFSPGFAERKVIMAAEILRLVRSRYKPPKSSTFKVAVAKGEPAVLPAEKVQQEPFERPRKIAGKSPPNMAGAIVLPARTTSTSSGFKIPKSAIPGQRLSYEGSLFGSTVSAAKPRKERHAHHVDCNEIDVIDISATTADNSIHEPPLPSHPFIDQESADSIVRRKVVDLVSPALIKINERLGKLEMGLKDVEQREPPKSGGESPSSMALTAGLSKQMNDVIFKLETLTSKVVLIENRLTMVEAKLDDREKYSHSMGSGYGLDSLKQQQTSEAALHHVKHAWSNKYDRNNNSNNNEILQNKGKSDHKSKNEGECSQENIDASGKKREKDGVEDDDSEDSPDVVVVQEAEKDDVKTKSKMAFMKTLVNPNDTDNTLVTETSAIDASVDTTASQQAAQEVKKSSTVNKRQPPAQPFVSSQASPLVDLVSPIRPLTSHFSHIQDESAISIPYAAYDGDSVDERRCTSTPTRLALDTSTLDRVSRISQMMTETKQLLQ